MVALDVGVWSGGYRLSQRCGVTTHLRPMSKHNSTTRRTVLQTTAGVLVGSGLAAGANAQSASETDSPDRLPADVAALVPAAEIEGGEQQVAMGHRRSGWSVRIDMTSDEMGRVHGGQRLEAFCTVRNHNRTRFRQSATAWFVVGHDPELVDQQTVQLSGYARSQITMGYSTFPVQQQVRFPVYAVISGPGGHDWDMVSVVVAPEQ